MSGLDTLMAKPFENALRNTLDEKMVLKVEGKILEKYGITISEAIMDFQKLDGVLKELLGAKTDSIEKEVIGKIVMLEHGSEGERGWITIEDAALAMVILESVGDNDKKNILNSVLDRPLIISDILEMVHMSQTSGYRKVNALIQGGMLIPHGFVAMDDGKRVTRYRSVFENMIIILEKNKLIIRVQPAMEAVARSSVLRSVGHWFRCGPISCI